MAQTAPQGADQSEVPDQWLPGRCSREQQAGGLGDFIAEKASQPFNAGVESRAEEARGACRHGARLVRALPRESFQPVIVLRPVWDTAADVHPSGQPTPLEKLAGCNISEKAVAGGLGPGGPQPVTKAEAFASPQRQGWTIWPDKEWQGAQQPAAKSKGKGSGEKKAVPSTKELPAPPTVDGIAKPTVSVKSEPTEEKSSSSSALLTQLMASRESLPPDIQALVDKEVEMDTKASTKQLHRLVSQQGSARRELQAISKMRDSFLLEWNSYICQLCTMVEQQLQAKAATLQELDQAEEAWRAQLSQATSSIAQASGVAPQSLVDTGEPIDLDTEQEDAEQAVAMAAAEASKKRKMIADLEAQEKSISAALAQARTVATESAEALRERTPRRSSRQEGKDFPYTWPRTPIWGGAGRA